MDTGRKATELQAETTPHARSETSEVKDDGIQVEPTMEEIVGPHPFKEGCFAIRVDIELTKQAVLNWKDHPEFQNEEASPNQHSEMKANLMLAYRHLEDARMRLGKAIQAYDGGTSCYPK